jgi:hypothetical protein
MCQVRLPKLRHQVLCPCRSDVGLAKYDFPRFSNDLMEGSRTRSRARIGTLRD